MLRRNVDFYIIKNQSVKQMIVGLKKAPGAKVVTGELRVTKHKNSRVVLFTQPGRLKPEEFAAA